MTIWLVEQGKFAELRKAHDAGLYPTATEQQKYEARCEAELEARDGRPRSLNVAGNVAEIRVEGLLTEKPSLFALIFGDGNTTYRDVRAALAEADANPAVSRIQFVIGSPGGTVDGLFETLAVIEGTRKPMSVTASFATSAAYAIAASAGKITATTAAATFGSVGVVASYLHDEELVQIVNTDSPNKRPDLNTEEGKQVVREYLDGLYEVFADAIARGRGVTANHVTKNFGRGSLFAAKEAKSRGMIDAIPRRSGAPASAPRADDGSIDRRPVQIGSPVEAESPPITAAAETPPQAAPQPSTPAPRETKQRSKSMDIATLKAEHPAVYSAILAEGDKAGYDRGVTEGTASERDRVSAHLIRGQTNNAMDLAVKCVEDGTPVTETIKAKYEAAGKSAAATQDRQEETTTAAAATATANEREELDPVDATADAMDRIYGKVG